MRTLNVQGVDEETLKGLLALASKGYQYCTRQCGRFGSPSCFSCMFRDIRKLHQKLSENGKGGECHG